MGQAKRKGTFEQRKAAAIAREDLKAMPQRAPTNNAPRVLIVDDDPRRGSRLAVAILMAAAMGERR